MSSVCHSYVVLPWSIVNTDFYESPMLQKFLSELSAVSEWLSIFEEVGIKSSFIQQCLYFFSVTDAEYRYLWFKLSISKL